MKQNDLYKRVYEYVKNIPEGKVTTYGKIAKDLEINSPRIVGRILHYNSEPQHVPCHRVVFADGSLTESFAFGGSKEQRFRLETEGIKFNSKNKVTPECFI